MKVVRNIDDIVNEIKYIKNITIAKISEQYHISFKKAYQVYVKYQELNNGRK